MNSKCYTRLYRLRLVLNRYEAEAKTKCNRRVSESRLHERTKQVITHDSNSNRLIVSLKQTAILFRLRLHTPLLQPRTTNNHSSPVSFTHTYSTAIRHLSTLASKPQKRVAPITLTKKIHNARTPAPRLLSLLRSTSTSQEPSHSLHAPKLQLHAPINTTTPSNYTKLQILQQHRISSSQLHNSEWKKTAISKT